MLQDFRPAGRALFLSLLMALFYTLPALQASAGISGITEEDGKIFLTDREGGKWRCYATGTGSLPLQCRRASGEEWTKIDVEKVTSEFVEDKEGNRYPVKY